MKTLSSHMLRKGINSPTLMQRQEEYLIGA